MIPIQLIELETDNLVKISPFIGDCSMTGKVLFYLLSYLDLHNDAKKTWQIVELCSRDRKVDSV